MALVEITQPVSTKTTSNTPAFNSLNEEIVTSIPATSSEGQSAVTHPLASLAGKYDDEPLWEAYLAAIREYRQELNEQENTTE